MRSPLRFPRYSSFWETGISRLAIINLTHEFEVGGHQEVYPVSTNNTHTRHGLDISIQPELAGGL